MNYESFLLVGKIVLLAWFITELTPLQMVFEWIAERNGVFNTVVYPALSCWYCLAFWVSFPCFYFNVDFVPEFLALSILGAFLAFHLQKLTKV